jgi:hypothetical protein
LIDLRLGKVTDHSGIGSKRKAVTPRRPLKVYKRTLDALKGRSFKRTAFKRKIGLRKVSKRQAKRNRKLRAKRMVVLAEQVRLYGTNRCEAGFRGWKGSCMGGLVLDHVNTRQVEDPDRYENLQILCEAHNGFKGSCRGLDFREGRMITRMREFDKE